MDSIDDHLWPSCGAEWEAKIHHLKVITNMCSFTASWWDACSYDIDQDNHNLRHSGVALVRLWLQRAQRGLQAIILPALLHKPSPPYPGFLKSLSLHHTNRNRKVVNDRLAAWVCGIISAYFLSSPNVHGRKWSDRWLRTVPVHQAARFYDIIINSNINDWIKPLGTHTKGALCDILR